MTRANPTYRMIDEDSFIERFGPRPNHLDLTTGFDFGDGGCLFSATGKDLRHVLAQDRRRVWTVLEDDEGRLVIESGLRIVNRLGYLVTRKPVEPHSAYTVQLDDGS